MNTTDTPTALLAEARENPSALGVLYDWWEERGGVPGSVLADVLAMIEPGEAECDECDGCGVRWSYEVVSGPRVGHVEPRQGCTRCGGTLGREGTGTVTTPGLPLASVVEFVDRMGLTDDNVWRCKACDFVRRITVMELRCPSCGLTSPLEPVSAVAILRGTDFDAVCELAGELRGRDAGECGECWGKGEITKRLGMFGVTEHKGCKTCHGTGRRTIGDGATWLLAAWCRETHASAGMDDNVGERSVRSLAPGIEEMARRGWWPVQHPAVDALPAQWWWNFEGHGENGLPSEVWRPMGHDERLGHYDSLPAAVRAVAVAIVASGVAEGGRE